MDCANSFIWCLGKCGVPHKQSLQLARAFKEGKGCGKEPRGGLFPILSDGEENWNSGKGRQEFCYRTQGWEGAYLWIPVSQRQRGFEHDQKKKKTNQPTNKKCVVHGHSSSLPPARFVLFILISHGTAGSRWGMQSQPSVPAHLTGQLGQTLPEGLNEFLVL